MKKPQRRCLYAFLIGACSFLLHFPATAAQPTADAGAGLLRIEPAAGIEIGEIAYRHSDATAYPVLEQAIIQGLDGFEGCGDDPVSNVRYFYDSIDLNGDDTPETIVYLVGQYTCGSGGCTSLVLQETANGYVPVARLSLVNNPILVSDEKTNGWRDLILYVSGGGAKGAYHVIRFSGKAYPGNPSVQPVIEPGAKLTGVALIADEILFDTPAPVLKSADCEGADTGSDLLATERLGELAVGMDAVRVAELLGEPKTRGEPMMSEADALFHGIWRFPAQGITLDMVADTADGEQAIASARCGLSCKLATQREIGIGATYEEVAEAYSDVQDEEGSEAPFNFVAGSLYGGLVFSFEEGKVIQIFLGAAAE